MTTAKDFIRGVKAEAERAVHRQSVPVIFRKERDGDVTAVFPTTVAGYNLMQCYAHVGQHSGCSFDWYRSTKPAKPKEYADLLAELRGIYERDGDATLVVYSRINTKLREEFRREHRRLY